MPAYENWIESQTKQDLQAIQFNHNSIHMESLTIRERILSTKCPDVAHPIVFRGAVCADNDRFDRCESLWLHALELRQNISVSINRGCFFFVATVNTIFQNAFHRFAAEIAVDFADAINFEKCSRQNINNYRIIFLSIFPVICTTRSIAFRSSIFADDSCVGAASHTKRKHPHSDPSPCRWPKWLILLVVFFLSVMARARSHYRYWPYWRRAFVSWRWTKRNLQIRARKMTWKSLWKNSKWT